MAKIYQIASVLYDVLRTVVPSSKVEDEVLFVFLRSPWNFPVLIPLWEL